MRYLCIYKPAKPEGEPPTQAEMAKMSQFVDEMKEAGVLLATEGCQSSSHGARIRLTGGTFTVKDGPFTEAKEVVGGFAILRTKSKEEALELNKRFLKVAGDGECEIRLLYDAPGQEG